MLVFDRRRDETIVIGANIEIIVVDIQGGKVKLGITAPPHISVHRKETYEAIKRSDQLQAPGTDKSTKVRSLAGRRHKPA